MREVDTVDSPPMQEPSFKLTRLGGVFGKPMAEYVLGFVLSRERKLPMLRDLQQKKEWHGVREGYDYRPLSSLTLGTYQGRIRVFTAR